MLFVYHSFVIPQNIVLPDNQNSVKQLVAIYGFSFCVILPSSSKWLRSRKECLWCILKMTNWSREGTYAKGNHHTILSSNLLT